jgi:hypothetical protein
MTYIYCKKVVDNIVANNLTDQIEGIKIKLDVFLLNDRITQENYTELTGLLDGITAA